MQPKYYTGIGPTNTPLEYMAIFSITAEYLKEKGYRLRSGEGKNADSAFREGVDEEGELYIPSLNFNDSPSALIIPEFDAEVLQNGRKYIMDNDIYKNIDSLKPFYSNMLLSTLFQLLGKDLSTPSSLLVCYADDSEPLNSRISLAIKIAELNKISVLNLYTEDGLKRVTNIINVHGELHQQIRYTIHKWMKNSVRGIDEISIDQAKSAMSRISFLKNEE